MVRDILRLCKKKADELVPASGCGGKRNETVEKVLSTIEALFAKKDMKPTRLANKMATALARHTQLSACTVKVEY